MARTRSTKNDSAGTKGETSSKSSVSKYSLSAKNEKPPTVFILPKRATQDARIVNLPNPRNAKPSRYLVCPTTGIYEFTKISAPKSMPRSWLIESNDVEDTPDASKTNNSHGQVASSADLYVATTIDPLFFVLPALIHADSSRKADEKRRLFMTIYDHLDKLETEESHMSEILRWEGTRSLLESRMAAVCDTTDGGSDLMYRLNENKLFAVILNKARKMCEGGLAPSMEEKFVTKALEAPVQMSSQRFSDSTQAKSVTEKGLESGVSTPQTESTDSQSTTATSQSDLLADSQASTAATSLMEDEDEGLRAVKVSDDIVHLQRLRTAFSFISSRYLTSSLATQLSTSLADQTTSGIDFAPLDTYHTELAKLRSEAAASRAIGDYTRKRGLDAEEEEARAEKKRKLEEEKKKKASESRATKELKKVNTAGMMKLSAFFKKK
ncbi:unnamed protein product [Clonostachys rosea]|uniref:Ribonuclease H2 subunit B n=1 Tax=Bionectria ochroleuca TaxID=29856 RepID=A0ABY6UUL7_BIOOC|nr:unnamed protein product [Clonostachys rosea]